MHVCMCVPEAMLEGHMLKAVSSQYCLIRLISPAVMVTSAGCTLAGFINLGIVDFFASSDRLVEVPRRGCRCVVAFAGTGISSISGCESVAEAMAASFVARYCSMWQLLTDICTLAACAGCVAGAFCSSGGRNTESPIPARPADSSGRTASPLLL